MEARSAWIKRIAGYAFAAIGLVWVLHDVDLRELSSHLIIRNWSWAAAAVAADVLAFLAQGWRWSLLLSPVGPLRLDVGFPFERPPGDAGWQVYFSIGQFF